MGSSTIQLVDTGISVNDQPVIEWNFISPSGIAFARRGGTVQAPYPKQPKCPPEFWRREKRVKQETNQDIVRLKEDQKKLQGELDTLSAMILKKADEFADACIMIKGLAATQKIYNETTGYPDRRVTDKLTNWNKSKRTLQREYECLQNSRTAILTLIQKLHQECLDIRLKERT